MRRSALALAGAVALAAVAALPQHAASFQTNSNPADLERPADLETWPTVGVTMRMDKTDGSVPWQMRHVLMAPRDYETFVRTGVYADRTRFAVVFYPVARDDTHTPSLYHARTEEGFAMHVVDRSHADGRRFYVFGAGETRASPLPAGNSCAVCHISRGGFDGTFTQLYPLMARRLKQPAAAD